MRHHEMSCEEHDHALTLLDALTGPSFPKPKAFVRRDVALDPLMIAAAAASGPHVTRNHYHHDFFPAVGLPKAEGAWDWTKWVGEDAGSKQDRKRLAYVSRQAPRRVRLTQAEARKENDHPRESDPLRATDNIPRRSTHADPILPKPDALAIPASKPPLEVKCLARTRIPTPHGPAFLHLYHNNWDNKEHLAIVIDPAQYEPSSISPPPIRSRSLDAVWSPTETEMDRITRGAYVGKLSSTSHTASTTLSSQRNTVTNSLIPPPLIRIHSECFTGETIGSMRCDCGEQLDEAIRLISQPITVPSPLSASSTTIPGRGAVVYLRQEGRGIGLLSKIRAYNLQDLGHDTVTANLMLGHKADERGYEAAGAILRDLGLGVEGGEGVRLLTNNPDKVKALEKEALKIVERVPMIPRSWQLKQPHLAKHASVHVEKDGTERVAGATLIGGGAVYGVDLDKYLRTKVLRMGHMLPLWMENSEMEL